MRVRKRRCRAYGEIEMGIERDRDTETEKERESEKRERERRCGAEKESVRVRNIKAVWSREREGGELMGQACGQARGLDDVHRTRRCHGHGQIQTLNPTPFSNLNLRPF